MEAKKLISVRIDQETLDLIDKFTRSRHYYTRSAVIANLLNAVMKCADNDTIWRMMSTSFPYEKGYTVQFKVDKNVMASRAKQTAN